MHTFLDVNEKPVVPCDGVVDFSILSGYQGECIGGFFLLFILSVTISTHSIPHMPSILKDIHGALNKALPRR
jgi:hypothetical protein